MKRLVLAAIIAILVLSAACICAEPIKLANKFKAGDKDTYLMTMTMSIRMPGLPSVSDEPIKMTVNSKIAQKVLGVLPDGSAKIKYYITSSGVSGLGSTGSRNSSAMKPMSMIVRMTPDGKTLSIEGVEGMPAIAGMDAGQFMNQLGMVGTLPPEPVSVGDSWTSKVPVPMSDQTLDMHSMLESDNCLVGKTRAAKIVQSYSGSLDVAKLMQLGTAAAGATGNPQAQAAMQSASGTMELTGDACSYIDVNTGKLLKTEGYSSVTSTIQLPPQVAAQGGPTSMTMKMGMQISVTKL